MMLLALLLHAKGLGQSWSSSGCREILLAADMQQVKLGTISPGSIALMKGRVFVLI